jgi:hypothetical protein
VFLARSPNVWSASASRSGAVVNSKTGPSAKEPARITPASLGAVATRPLIVALISLLALVQMSRLCAVLPARATRCDFSIYYMSAVSLREGLNPYKTDFRSLGRRLGVEAWDIYHATDPPPFLLLISWLALMPERTAYYTWTGINAIMLAAVLALLFGRSAGLGGRTGLVLASLALMYPPIHIHIFQAQSKILILLLLVLMMRSMEQEWDRAAGLFLAFAGLLRAFPLLLIGYLAIQRRRTALLWTFIGLAVGGMITVACLGPSISLSFRDGAALLTSQRWLNIRGNIGLAANVSRLFLDEAGNNPGLAMQLARVFSMSGVSAALLGATIWATLRLEPGHDPDWAAFSMWVVASVLLSPMAGVHCMVLFLIPFAQLAAAACHSGVSTRVQWLALASYALIATTMMVRVAAPSLQTDQTQLVARLDNLVIEEWLVTAMLLYFATYCMTLEACDSSHAMAIEEGGL